MSINVPGRCRPTRTPPSMPARTTVAARQSFVGATSFNGLPVVRRGSTELWAVGLRNPWRMSFDAATGQLCAPMSPENAREEINLIVRGGNHGWSYREAASPDPAPIRQPAPTFITRRFGLFRGRTASP